MKFILSLSLIVILCFSCDSKKSETIANDIVKIDSIEFNLKQKVLSIIGLNDSLDKISSLEYSLGENEKYAIVQLNENNQIQKLVEEDFTNDYNRQREIYFENNEIIFIKEMYSELINQVESYSESLVFIKDEVVYKAYVKKEYNELPLFSEMDNFEIADFDINEIDFDKIKRALLQRGEFEMRFDQFLSIEPQTYLIVENADKTINVALFIKEGDEVLNKLFENQKDLKGRKLSVNHYFEEMNGVTRMIYNGAVFIED